MRAAMRCRKPVRRSCYFLFQYPYGPIPLDQHHAAGVTPDGVLGSSRIHDIAAAPIVAGLIGLCAFQDQDGFEPLMSMPRYGGSGLVFQKGDPRLIVFESADPVDRNVLTKRREN